jgi:hypothetical protein
VVLAQAAISKATSTLDPGVPLVTPWVVIPLAIVAMLLIAGHIMNLRADREMPDSRRRIRLANAWLMMLLSPIGAMAFSIVTPGQAREFVLLMSIVVGMLGFIVILACADAVNNLRLHRAAVRELREEVAKVRLEAQIEEAKRARLGQGRAEKTAPATSDGKEQA